MIETLLREVREAPSLVDLAMGSVVEEGLGVGQIPTTLKVKVAGLLEERMKRPVKIMVKIKSPAVHAQTVVKDMRQVVLLIAAELAQLLG